MLDPAALVLAALVIDMVVGDPAAIYRHLSHPVALIGNVIAFGDRTLNVCGSSPAIAFASGTLLTIIVLGLTVGAATMIHLGLAAIPGGGYLEALIASTLIAFRSLFIHVREVALALDDGLQAARTAVAHIVGRDPERLDETGVARAAIESAAENFSDGVVAPMFWGLLLGLPGIAAYKAVNTLDSMIGHRTPHHIYFGRAAARLDDVFNWLPARISGILFCIAAALMRGADARRAWICMLRDARKHRSPNAGWQEAAVAGALGIALAGPRRYGTLQVDDAWMGLREEEVSAAQPHGVSAVDVHRALRLYLIAGAVLTALLTIVVAVTLQR